MNQTPPITDSPWLWLALFSAVGLSALLATGGKFGKRQSGIERRYQARDWQARMSDPENGIKDGANESLRSGPEQVTKPEYSTPNKTLIGLWPLAGVLGTLCGTSLVMLYYTRKLQEHSRNTHLATFKSA